MIRRYRPEDSAAVVVVWRAASDLAHPFLSSAFQDAEADNVRHVYPQFADIWVREVAGEVIGFIALIGSEVGAIFVAPTYHGQGVGRALMDFAVARKGALTVQVFRANAIGRRFYEAYGFVAIDECTHEETGQSVLTLAFDPAT